VEVASAVRYAFARRRSWIFTTNAETTIGIFDTSGGFKANYGGTLCFKRTLGLEAFFSRGKRGASFYIEYHLDILPTAPDQSEFTLGHSRFSKDGLAQIGIRFFD